MGAHRVNHPALVECALCQRQVPPDLITLHHLTPREKGGRPEHRVQICKPCHKQVHAVFSNAELARVYPTITALRLAPRLQTFLKWIRRQKGSTVFRTRTSATHPDARKRRRRR